MLNQIRDILLAEAKVISSLPIDKSAVKAVEAMLSCKGKVFVTGIGKAGYVARKTASTFSTTGTPSVYLHPGDASHGDVGVITKNDILLAFSNSGKTREILETVHFSRYLGVEAVITVTSSKDSPLGQESDIVIELGHIEEPCPLGLTPTASTTAMIAIADALALTAMKHRGFTKSDFAARHHGGYLGKKLREENEDT
ncbi:MAG: SIS domain-containing protein [Deltaproteobacteria bacterium]|nr:SIS domain-containing protein [Deltaproteobacteria bacterium]